MGGTLVLAVAAPAVAAPCLLPPVDVPVAEHFRAPECRWCPGHRGLGYRTDPGTPVRAVAAGRVEFVGLVAGVRWVVVRHPDGLRASYGHLRSTQVRTGQAVGPGQVIGASATELHLGLRRGDEYLDPEPWFGRPVGRPRLVPVAGPGGRPAGRPGAGRPDPGRSGSRPALRALCPVPVVATRSPR